MSFARTVLGDRPSEELGVTLPHEHLLIDTSVYIDEATHGQTVIQQEKLQTEVCMEELWWMSTYGRQWEWRSYDKYRLDDVDEITEEVLRFKHKGGETLVDVTPMTPANKRAPTQVAEIARRTGLNVIAGTGHYVKASYPPEYEDQTADDVAEEIISDIEDGMDDTGVPAGIIGEVGATAGFAEHESEHKSFRAAAMAQAETGAPITVHTTGFTHEAHDILDVLEAAGADLSNVILGHMDVPLRTDGVEDYLRSLADRGPFIEFDTFGRIGFIAAMGGCFPLDEDRIEMLSTLVDDGYDDQLLVSTDVCQKTHLTRYAGFGYDYLLRDIVPRLRMHDFDEQDIDQLLVDNPARAVSFAT